MKKENKELARQRKAKELKKQKTMAIAKNLISVGLSLAAIALIFVLLFVKEVNSENNTDQAGATNGTTLPTTTATVYSNDKNREIKLGDKVNIDYVGSVDGVEFSGGNTRGNGADLIIGSHMYIDDFEEQLIGHKAGDEVDVEVTFPEVYKNNPDLAGKDALFKVTINGIYE